MTETLTLTPHRTIAPLTMIAVTIALVAALALGFGIRTWTEHTATSSPSAAAPVVQPVTPPAVQSSGSTDDSGSIIRLGRPH